MFDQIEQLKQKYTDKYVVVDERRPELSRFKGFAGVVKTVNMSGRALVEFDAYANVGWFDIELDYLKVVDQPPPKPAERQEKPAKAEAAPAKPKAAAPAGEKKLSPLEAARAQGPAKKLGAPATQSTGKQSTADILAAARGGAAPAKPAGGEKKPSTAEILAAARTAKGEAPASKPAESAAPAAAAPKAAAPKAKLSTSDILAAARKNAAAAASAPAEAGAAAPVAPAAASSAAPETAAAPEEAPAPAPSAKPAKAAPAGGLPTGTAEISAWCRQRDAK